MFVYLKESLINDLLEAAEFVDIREKGDWIEGEERYHTCGYGCILCSG